METAKKRKRDDEVDPPRITYDAATRTFDRLFKEESLGEMKNVVRKKLGVSTAVPVYLSQIRDGKSVDLDDDEDFEAFRAATRSLTIAKIKVVLGGHPTNGQLVNGSAIEPKTPKRKKKKQRISDAIASTSSVLSERPFGEPPATNEESISTPHKKRRVSFLEPPTLEQISTQSLLPETPKKKKTKPTGDPLPKSAIANEADVQFIQQLPETDTDEQAPRTKKKKKNLDQPKGDISGLQQDEVSSTISQVTDTASAQADESTSKKSKKKRRREDPEPNVITEPEDNASTSAVQAAKQLAQEEDTTRPAKKSKKQNADPTDEVTTKKSSRSKSVPPPAVEPPAAAAPVLDDEEPEAPSTKAKKTKKKKDREVSEPPTKEVATKPAHLEEQEDEAVVPPKKKSKFKQKDVTVLDETNPDTSKPTASLNKSLEKEKLAEVSSASAIEPSGSLNDDQPPEKAQKSSKKDRSRSKAPEEDVQPEDVEPTTVDGISSAT
ncbi:hypothetical protein CPB83DRAFT_452462 [Crepidotus variabilis]|uniref:Uncharacterized protein n=1 Tax=Crepidotus variabilis TaxID=179855 RepID=A0A9P6ECX7_9AGAR|nr:hypothetical protein CPB83DRAFT_452462 [Crepidotus variabilis]